MSYKRKAGKRKFSRLFFGLCEALPHTPFKELFEKSSLKILKNFKE